jgi:hypothetical protein
VKTWPGAARSVLVTDVNLATAEATAEGIKKRGSEAHAMHGGRAQARQVEAMAKTGRRSSGAAPTCS